MKLNLRYSILITLFLATTMAISVVFAVPTYIGWTKQSQPFEAQPTSYVRSPVHTGWNPLNVYQAYDGDDYSSTALKITNTLVTGSLATITFSGFTTPPPIEGFSADWVDLKIIYEIPTQTGDDTYKIEYTTDGATWIELVPPTRWDAESFAKAARPWPQIATSDGSPWDWATVASLQVRFSIAKSVAWDTNRQIIVYEIWASVYSFPLPPSSSTAISVMPPVALGVPADPGAMTGLDNIFFVDVYLQGYTGTGAGLWGYQVTIKYDTNIVTAIDHFSYWPFISQAVVGIDDTDGSVSISYYTFSGDTVGFEGDMTPLTRIYFMIDAGGTSVLDLLDQRPNYITELKPVGLGAIIPPLYDGYIGSPSYMSYQGSTIPAPPWNPTGSTWHEMYPTYCQYWNVIGWIDNTDGTFSVSDQIEMELDGTTTVVSYHVDKITTTIHWTFKPDGVNPEEGNLGAAEPLEPMEPPFEFDPIGTIWHQIYPVYCRYFEITSWIDNSPGEPGVPNGIFDASDQFDFIYYDDMSEAWAHLDDITTDIWVSPKPSLPPVPEFPIGLGIVMAVAPMIAIAYIWRLRKKSR